MPWYSDLADFCTELPHYLWSISIESFYIPPYRWEWGKFRNWTYDKYGQWTRNLSSRDKEQALKEKARRQDRKRLIQEHRREGISGRGTSTTHHLGCRRLRINCGGLKFETQERTLQEFPESLLGDPQRRQRYWNPTNQEFFFDRHAECFECILHYYQTGGSRMERPSGVSTEVFGEELKFFDLQGQQVDKLIKEVTEVVPSKEVQLLNLPQNLLQRKIWLLVEIPESSHQAHVFSILSIIAILLSTSTYILETMDMFTIFKNPNEVVDLRDPMFLAETVSVSFFTFELILRILSCPHKMAFVQNFTNVIDFLSIVPYTAQILIFLSSHEHGGGNGLQYASLSDDTPLGTFLRLVNVIRVFRILKLSRYSVGLRILGQTLHASLHELGLLSFFLIIGVILFSSALYFVESHYDPSSNFTSIPGTFFWAVSTMTTTGFDANDELPTTVPGKIIGSMCAVAGVLTLSLPVPVIVANFTYFYHRGTKSQKRIKKKYIRSCPFLPTCKEDDGVLNPPGEQP